MARQQGQALEHFRAVRDGIRLPRFAQARALQVTADSDLWAAHMYAILRMRLGKSIPRGDENQLSLLDLKIRLADRIMESCDLCPHHCHTNRNQGQTGFCGVAAESAVHWEGILEGEEIDLAHSHEVFLSGCTMRCAFCFAHAHITRPMSGTTMTPLHIAQLAERRCREGAANLNLVGGEPTVHIPNILRALNSLEASLPVVWNSNLYATPRAMALLDGVVDLFLGDIHFGNDTCARRLGQIPDYLPSVQAAFVAAVDSGASVIIRHLVMPGHLECCARPAMQWAKAALPDTPFHLMFQYVPDYRAARDPALGRFLSKDEIAQARRMADEIGVNLFYDDYGPMLERRIAQGAGAASGQPVDILIQGDGRVSFTRLMPDLLPVAAALNDNDARIRTRAGIQEGGG
jgi:putative pyruvate formate lyase activating enzyme